MVNFINNLSYSSLPLLSLLLHLVHRCLDFNIWFHSRHVPGVYNCEADALPFSLAELLMALGSGGAGLMPLVQLSLVPMTWRVHGTAWDDWAAVAGSNGLVAVAGQCLESTLHYLLPIVDFLGYAFIFCFKAVRMSLGPFSSGRF